MGLIRGVARTAAIAGTASAVSGRVQHRQQGRYAAEDAEAQAQAAAAAPAPVAASAADDQMAELEKLAEMKDKGILTEEEFTAKKAQILGL